MKSTKNKIYLLLGGILLLFSTSVFLTGSGHQKVVVKNVELHGENQKLTKENKKLTEENTQLKVVADSLVETSDSLKQAVSTLENTVIENEKNNEKAPVDNSADDSKPYKLFIPDQEIPDSP